MYFIALSYLTFTILLGWCYYAHFIDRDVEAQKEVIQL